MQALSPEQLLPSHGWWVARTAPQYVLKVRNAVDAESWVPLRQGGRPLISYVFVRANGHPSNAWTLPGFRGWLTTGSKRAIVSDEEFEKFRVQVEARGPQRREQILLKRGIRLLLKVNAGGEIRTLGAA